MANKSKQVSTTDQGQETMAVTVRLSATAYRKLERIARAEHRKLGPQAAYILEQALAHSAAA